MTALIGVIVGAVIAQGVPWLTNRRAVRERQRLGLRLLLTEMERGLVELEEAVEHEMWDPLIASQVVEVWARVQEFLTHLPLTEWEQINGAVNQYQINGKRPIGPTSPASVDSMQIGINSLNRGITIVKSWEKRTHRLTASARRIG